jgi:hypothetical protein
MTDRKDALVELLAKVEAGWPSYYDVENIVLVMFPNDIGFQLTPEALRILNAYHGSLDAAKELHEAVLGVGFNYSIHKDSASVMTWAHTVEGKTFNATNANPARAWLIAILKALIAGENTNDNLKGED